MVDNRPLLNILTHAVLIAGVAIVVFPVYLAFVASTHSDSNFVSGLVPLYRATSCWSTMGACSAPATRRPGRPRSS